MTERIVVHVDPDLEDLIPGFLENRRKDIGQMQADLAGGDLERIRITGHSMKGAGGGYGFDAITDIGAAIEQAAKAGDRTAIEHSIQALQDYLDRIEVVFD